MILSTLQVVIPPKKRKDFLEILRIYLGPACFQPGCISCNAYLELDNEDSLILVEKWQSKAYLDQHLSSSEYRKILALMDLSVEPPRIEFVTMSELGGMNVIEKARESP
jgi:quinol monooxygenase YgiN